MLWVEIFELYWGAEKRLKIGGEGGRWCQVSDGVLACLRVVEEIKAPVVAGVKGYVSKQFKVKYLFLANSMAILNTSPKFIFVIIII